MLKRFCRTCGKRVQDVTLWHCDTCQAYLNMKSKPIPIRKNQPGEEHFAFFPSETDKLLESDKNIGQVLGKCEQNKKDTEHYSVTINLYHLRTVEEVVKCLVHEWTHVSIARCSDWQTSHNSERILAKLEREGYL